MAEPSIRCLAHQMQSLSIQHSHAASTIASRSFLLLRPSMSTTSRFFLSNNRNRSSTSIKRGVTPSTCRTFSTTTRTQDWLTPKRPEKSKSRVGRPRMPTGGSTRGTTVVWGDYGLRMKDHDRRVSAKQLKIGEETIKRRLRGTNFKLYTRVSANIGVYTKGNEVRMGKGKGKFDYWAARIPVSRVIFEVAGSNLHEQVVKDAFRLAGHKLPGLYEFVRKGDPPVVGLTKLGNGVTLQSLKEARRLPVAASEETAKNVDPQVIVPPSLAGSAPTSVSASM